MSKKSAWIAPLPFLLLSALAFAGSASAAASPPLCKAIMRSLNGYAYIPNGPCLILTGKNSGVSNYELNIQSPQIDNGFGDLRAVTNAIFANVTAVMQNYMAPFRQFDHISQVTVKVWLMKGKGAPEPAFELDYPGAALTYAYNLMRVDGGYARPETVLNQFYAINVYTRGVPMLSSGCVPGLRPLFYSRAARFCQTVNRTMQKLDSKPKGKPKPH